jgi:hypothetical protein
MLPLGTVNCQDMDGNVLEETEGVLCGNHDRLRGILMASAKEAAFRKVINIIFIFQQKWSSLSVKIQFIFINVLLNLYFKMSGCTGNDDSRSPKRSGGGTESNCPQTIAGHWNVGQRGSKFHCLCSDGQQTFSADLRRPHVAPQDVESQILRY